jgi:hypothetical protein
MSKFIWIRRRARMIMGFYELTPGSAKAIRVAVQSAAEDWQWLNVMGLPL